LIYSIGHGGKTVGEVEAIMAALGVSYLVDVRSSPYSKYQPDFSKKELLLKFSGAPIKYVFMGELLGGRPKDPGCYTGGHVDYEKIKEKDFYQRGIDRLEVAVSKGIKICLICSEAHPGQCHRSKLIGASLQERGHNVIHVLSDKIHLDQRSVMSEVLGRQKGLFGDSLMSRKSYG